MQKRQRIKALIIRRKDDFLTALEKNWRDSLFRPLTRIFQKLGITANQITILSFLLLPLAIAMHVQHSPLSWQIALLTFIGFSDAIDGPVARNNNNVTVLGTWLDHLRDGSLVAWVTYLLYSYNLLSLELIIAIWSLELVLVWATIKDFLLHYLKHNTSRAALMNSFSLDNLQASVIGRLQFVFWTIGYLTLLLYTVWPEKNLIAIGHGLIIVEIVFGAMNIFEAYQRPLRKPATPQNISS